MTEPLTIRSYPRAILHIDGDAFFASCEQARNPDLKGRPVITGKERGIAASMSYEAKSRGIERGMSTRDIRKICPDAVFLPSDYETYSLLSRRFYAIVRRFTPEVEEYGVDECFADITGLRRLHRMPYEQIGEKIQQTLIRELGFTFSVGLAPTKTLAKVASKWRKPFGFTAIEGSRAHIYLAKLPVGKVWGIGPQTTAFFKKHGVVTALDFAKEEETWVELYLSKPFFETWKELRGILTLELETKPKESYASIQKVKTFTPLSKDSEFIFAQLSKNIENACIKMRRYKLSAREVTFFLKFQNFRYTGYRVRMVNPVGSPTEIISLAREHWDEFFKKGGEYRATGVHMGLLVPHSTEQLDFFGGSKKEEKMTRLFEAVDDTSKRYGKHTLYLGSSLHAHQFAQHVGDRGDNPQRKNELFKGETGRQRIGIPMLMKGVN